MVQSVTIELPLRIYDHLSRIARYQNRSIPETVGLLVEQAEPEPEVTLPVETEQELAALSHLSDDSLWVLAQQVLTEAQQAEWAQLNETEQRSGQLDPAAKPRQMELLALYDYVVLRRAVALNLLQERGRDITPLLTLPNNRDTVDA